MMNFIALLLAAVPAQAAPSVADDAPPAMTLTMTTTTQRLEALAKGNRGAKSTAKAAKNALRKIGGLCAPSLTVTPDLKSLLAAYAEALASKKEGFTAQDVYLILGARDAIRCALVERMRALPEDDYLCASEQNLSDLGLCQLYAEGVPYTVAPSNDFLRAQFKRVLSVDEQEFLAIEEQYFAAFNGEYFSSEPLRGILTRARRFLEANPSSPRGDAVRAFIADTESHLKRSREANGNALNAGPGVCCR